MTVDAFQCPCVCLLFAEVFASDLQTLYSTGQLAVLLFESKVLQLSNRVFKKISATVDYTIKIAYCWVMAQNQFPKLFQNL